MKLNRLILLAALMLFALAACRHGGAAAPRPRPKAEPEILKLTKEQTYERAEQFFTRRKYLRARTYFTYVYENYPNDPLGRRALLRVADSYFAQGDPVSLVDAQYKYRDFINRYPGSDKADYAMLQIAMVSYKQMEKPDRDQLKTREAQEKLSDMIRTYPRSPMRPEAEKRLQEVLDRLAKHEHIIAAFYIKRHSYTAAVTRLNYIVEHFPNYNERAGTFFDLGTALDGLGRGAEARLYYERVVSEFPQSEYAGRAKRRLDQKPKAA